MPERMVMNAELYRVAQNNLFILLQYSRVMQMFIILQNQLLVDNNEIYIGAFLPVLFTFEFVVQLVVQVAIKKSL